MLGLYIHIPFCANKCEYCDFYSINYNTNIVENYVEEVCRRLKNIDFVFDTVYFGGGTPSLIGSDNLIKILKEVKYRNNAEITVEVNPKSYKNDFFDDIYKAGFNRVSIGMQSGVDSELKFLTRKHKFDDVVSTVELARKGGFKNISLDLMIGLQNQTFDSLEESIEKCISLNPEHISSYMLKVEENTPFFKKNLDLPDDDIVSDMYLFLCEKLTKEGYYHYEISNFARENKQSKHNLIYWNCDEYLGLGPGAHSFLNNKRYYFPNDINYFLNKNEMIYLEDGGSDYEKAMLGLRLSNGIDISNFNDSFIKKAKKYTDLGYGFLENNRFKLNEKGFLIQNTILTDLLEEL